MWHSPITSMRTENLKLMQICYEQTHQKLTCIIMRLYNENFNWIRAPLLRHHLTLITSLMVLSPNTVTLGVGFSTFEFWGHIWIWNSGFSRNASRNKMLGPNMSCSSGHTAVSHHFPHIFFLWIIVVVIMSLVSFHSYLRFQELVWSRAALLNLSALLWSVKSVSYALMVIPCHIQRCLKLQSRKLLLNSGGKMFIFSEDTMWNMWTSHALWGFKIYNI